MPVSTITPWSSAANAAACRFFWPQLRDIDLFNSPGAAPEDVQNEAAGPRAILISMLNISMLVKSCLPRRLR